MDRFRMKAEGRARAELLRLIRQLALESIKILYYSRPFASLQESRHPDPRKAPGGY